MSKNKVIVFVKNTISGKVKTRLAKTIVKDEALRVYLRLLAITKEEVSKVRAEKEVWYAWEVSENDIWDENYFKKKVQIEGDLGEKMKKLIFFVMLGLSTIGFSGPVVES